MNEVVYIAVFYGAILGTFSSAQLAAIDIERHVEEMNSSSPMLNHIVPSTETWVELSDGFCRKFVEEDKEEHGFSYDARIYESEVDAKCSLK